MDEISNCEIPLGERLLAQGWDQGTLFSAPGAIQAWNVVTKTDDELKISLSQSSVKSRHKLLLVTQACDIKASVEQEPYVEALLCRKAKADFHEKCKNSARYFSVDPIEGWAALAAMRISIHKESLEHFSPEPWPSGTNRDKFVRWLARRYDRPPLPDEFVTHFQEPLTDVMQHFATDSPTVHRAFNSVVEEIRVNVQDHDEPPFDTHLLLVLEDERLSREAADAIDTFQRMLSTALDTSKVVLDKQVVMRDPEHLSLYIYRATVPLFFDYYSFDGNEVIGVIPPAPA